MLRGNEFLLRETENKRIKCTFYRKEAASGNRVLKGKPWVKNSIGMQILVALSFMGSCKPVKSKERKFIFWLNNGVFVKPNFASTCVFVREAVL